MIDNMQMYEYSKTKNKLYKDNNVFDTEIYNSILNQTASIYKENSQLLKKRNDQLSFEFIHNSNDSLEKIINKISSAEDGIALQTKKKFFMFNSGSCTITSNHEEITPERRTIEVSSVNKGIKIDELTKRFHLKNKSDLRHNTKITDLTSIKSIREKLAENLKTKYELNNGKTANKSKPKSKPDSAIPTQSGLLHKTTLSMPKLTNNIFYIINQNPQLNTQITIYQNVDNKPLSPKMTKEINNNTINGKKPKLHAEKKKDYKKLLRPEMFNVKDEIKKSPFEVKITKVQNKNKSNFAEENKNSKDQNTTTRNVIIF
jgi:hypothetical protein